MWAKARQLEERLKHKVSGKGKKRVREEYKYFLSTLICFRVTSIAPPSDIVNPRDLESTKRIKAILLLILQGVPGAYLKRKWKWKGVRGL